MFRTIFMLGSRSLAIWSPAVHLRDVLVIGPVGPVLRRPVRLPVGALLLTSGGLALPPAGRPSGELGRWGGCCGRPRGARQSARPTSCPTGGWLSRSKSRRAASTSRGPTTPSAHAWSDSDRAPHQELCPAPSPSP